jgi:integrase
MTFLTRDNPLLSEPKTAHSHTLDDRMKLQSIAIFQPSGEWRASSATSGMMSTIGPNPARCQTEHGQDDTADTGYLPDRVVEFVRNGLAGNTRRAYRFDLQHFEAWGGRLPCDPQMVASYLAEHAESLAVATLARRLAAITQAHEALGYDSPVRSHLVRATLRGIRRGVGAKQREAKPLLREDLFRVIDAMGDRIKDTRDRALLLVGFAGGLRRSEIVALDGADFETARQGLIVHLRRSKTDQEGIGRKIGIPFGRTRFCPVAALEQWRARSGIAEGAVFRPVDRHERVAPERLSDEAVSTIVKERVAKAGFDPDGYSGHSLRAGLATSAAQAGISAWRIRQQTGHASDAMLSRYIRDGELFTDNAAGALL